VANVSFFLEDADDGEDGVVGQRRILGQSLKDLVNRGRSFLPEHVHDAQLGFGQSCGLGAGQGVVLLLYMRRVSGEKVN
jgi:hypothetical protein